ncbi:MAG TPA: hypothetical protein VGR28_15185 [Candidatus Thermoplasmatota archaeon]|jgi:hypothetical protein|nr:hypothetical protein [Candidatus Thermoplasmatota archaeon]
MRTLPVLAVGLCLLAAVPTGDALAHFVKWKASGVAVGGDGTAYLIDVQWNGGFWCSSTYTVTLKNVLGAVVEQRTFYGYENLVLGPGQNTYQENFQVSGADLEGTVDFTVSGEQLAFINTMPHVLTNVLRGTYNGLQWVAVTPASPFVFGC